MTDIKGIPEGWKAKEYDFVKVGDYVPMVGTDGSFAQKIPRGSCHIGRLDLIIERDIKIIDMSKCKVDVEYYSDTINDWIVCDKDQALKAVSVENLRVRENHYFGWRGGECPLPHGLCITVFYRDGSNHNLLTYRDPEIWAHKYNAGSDAIGFVVNGSAETHAYQHQIEVE